MNPKTELGKLVNSQQATDHLVFISYASPDRERVLHYADALKKMGYEIWLDVKEILPGQNWDIEINRGLSKATFILVFISKNSVDRRGYVQKEIKRALGKREEKLADDIYIIPVLLDAEVAIPIGMEELQFVKESDGDAEEKLNRALSHQLERLGMQQAQTEEQFGIRWYKSSIKETRDGIPGYEIDIEFLRFASDEYQCMDEVNCLIKSDLIQHVMDLRRDYFEPESATMNFGQDKFFRTHTLDISFSTPSLTGKVMSLVTSIHTYCAGAAHPNHGFTTYNFLLDPHVWINNPEWLFQDEDAALKATQEATRETLTATNKHEDDSFGLQKEWVFEGTNDWECFTNFTLTDEGLEFYFAPYQVGPYAAGPQFIKIPFRLVHEYMKPQIKAALGIEYKF